MAGCLSAIFTVNFKKKKNYSDFFSIGHERLYINFRVKKTLPVTFDN